MTDGHIEEFLGKILNPKFPLKHQSEFECVCECWIKPWIKNTVWMGLAVEITLHPTEEKGSVSSQAASLYSQQVSCCLHLLATRTPVFTIPHQLCDISVRPLSHFPFCFLCPHLKSTWPTQHNHSLNQLLWLSRSPPNLKLHGLSLNSSSLHAEVSLDKILNVHWSVSVWGLGESA